MVQRLFKKPITKSKTTMHNKNKEKVVINVDKLIKICWKNSLVNIFNFF